MGALTTQGFHVWPGAGVVEAPRGQHCSGGGCRAEQSLRGVIWSLWSRTSAPSWQLLVTVPGQGTVRGAGRVLAVLWVRQGGACEAECKQGSGSSERACPGRMGLSFAKSSTQPVPYTTICLLQLLSREGNRSHLPVSICLQEGQRV